MGFMTGMFKFTGKMLGEGAELYMRQSMKGIKELKIPFKEKISDLKTDCGVDAEYVQNLIKQAKSSDSLKAIRDYLQSNRNDIPANITKRMINQVTEKAKYLEHAKQLKKMIQDQPDPLSFVSDHAHTIHDVVHYVTEWMV